MTLDLGPIKERAERATKADDLTLTRYDHGGGRMFVVGGPDAERRLVADFFDEPDREFYANSPKDIPALVAEVEALRSLAKTLVRGVMLAEGDFDDAPPHRPPWLADAIIAAGLIP